MKLRELREKAGYKQIEIAEKVGLSLSTYSAYEIGYRTIPTDVAEKLAKIYGMTVEDIFLPARFTSRVS